MAFVPDGVGERTTAMWSISGYPGGQCLASLFTYIDLEHFFHNGMEITILFSFHSFMKTNVLFSSIDERFQ